jgi:DNA-binding transcriptional ArsR family regulator
LLPELYTYAPTVTAEFHLSLPQDLVTSLRLLQAVDAFEGMSEWVYQTAATLPDDFRAELNLLGYPIKWCFRRQDSLIWRLPPDQPAHSSWGAFCSYLEQTPAAEFQRVLFLNLAHEARTAYAPTSPDDAVVHQMIETVRHAELEKWGRTFVDLVDDEPLITLIQAAEELKRRLISLLTRFWEHYYRHDFERHRQAMAHSVTYHRQQTYPHSFSDLFRQVTGRTLLPSTQDLIQEHLERVERVIFCPCAHLGLYFHLTMCYPALVVAFNYRTTPAQASDGAITAELFPPLKALADESRLHILSLLQTGEMYAQEIVEAVDLSQSTVSRHLQLLERTELITSRQARGMKFYSINRAKGRTIVEALQRLIG